jgi:hypothetical protein
VGERHLLADTCELAGLSQLAAVLRTKACSSLRKTHLLFMARAWGYKSELWCRRADRSTHLAQLMRQGRPVPPPPPLVGKTPDVCGGRRGDAPHGGRSPTVPPPTGGPVLGLPAAGGGEERPPRIALVLSPQGNGRHGDAPCAGHSDPLQEAHDATRTLSSLADGGAPRARRCESIFCSGYVAKLWLNGRFVNLGTHVDVDDAVRSFEATAARLGYSQEHGAPPDRQTGSAKRRAAEVPLPAAKRSVVGAPQPAAVPQPLADIDWDTELASADPLRLHSLLALADLRCAARDAARCQIVAAMSALGPTLLHMEAAQAHEERITERLREAVRANAVRASARMDRVVAAAAAAAAATDAAALTEAAAGMMASAAAEIPPDRSAG